MAHSPHDETTAGNTQSGGAARRSFSHDRVKSHQWQGPGVRVDPCQGDGRSSRPLIHTKPRRARVDDGANQHRRLHHRRQHDPPVCRAGHARRRGRPRAIDLSMITCDARGDQARGRELALMLAARKVDGVLVVGDNNAVTASVSRFLDIPVVYVYGISDDAADVVHMPDDENGSALAVDHLISIGRRRIAHLTGPRGSTAVVERVKGMRARLRQDGLRVVGPVQYGTWSQRWARRAIAAVLTDHPDIDAVLCGSDQIASGVVMALKESGRQVPRRRRGHGLRQLERVRIRDRAAAHHGRYEPRGTRRRRRA